jgi:NAD(P)-dependent dehydrogenase (short-subunit alcohol dehydrogenase family)
MDDVAIRLASAHLPLRGDRLEGRVVLVSGAGSGGDLIGVGAAIATLLAAQGARVGVIAQHPDRCEATLEGVRRLGGVGIGIAGDIADSYFCRGAVRQVVEAYGRLDVLVNSAAIARYGDIATVTRADWDVTFAVDLTAVMELCQASVPALSARGGSIVNVSSFASMRGGCGSAAYAAAKAGLEGLTRDMAASLGPSGIRANCLVPGFLYAPMGARDEPERDARRMANALQTEGTAWDAAWATLFLTCDEGRWITGVTLPVDGGLVIVKPRTTR